MQYFDNYYYYTKEYLIYYKILLYFFIMKKHLEVNIYVKNSLIHHILDITILLYILFLKLLNFN
jgi:hypothetical protein